MSITAVTLAALVLNGCGGGGGDGGTPPAPQPAAVAVTISPTTAMVSIGDTRTLTAVVTDANSAVIVSPSVTWTSSAPTLISVNPTTGLTTTATAVANGSATITATSGTASGSKTASLLQKFSSLVLTPATVPLAPSGTRQLAATARDARGGEIVGGATGVAYSSNNTSAATVTPSGGLVTAVANGTATITGTLTRDAVTASGTSVVTVTTTGFPSAASVAATTSSTFVPPSVDITAAGTVTWNFAAVEHTVNFSAAGSPTNIGPTSSASVSRTFPSAGTFPYECAIHSGMTGTVIVH